MLGAFAGAGIGILVPRLFQAPETAPEPPPPSPPPAAEVYGEPGTPYAELAPAPDSPEGIAWRYARAFQEGDWDFVLERTQWMRERLAHVAAQTGSPEAAAGTRAELAERLATRTPEGSQLAPEGIEDQYIFVPGAALRIAGSDAGAEDLEEPVARRVWLEVTYPDRLRAPRTGDGLPIQRLRAGVSVSHSGRILKGSVIGNLEIDEESLALIWNGR